MSAWNAIRRETDPAHQELSDTRALRQSAGAGQGLSSARPPPHAGQSPKTLADGSDTCANASLRPISPEATTPLNA
ncbi:MAG: hypothetical protein R3E56_10545 [Burkholderiaceae bacterium]